MIRRWDRFSFLSLTIHTCSALAALPLVLLALALPLLPLLLKLLQRGADGHLKAPRGQTSGAKAKVESFTISHWYIFWALYVPWEQFPLGNDCYSVGIPIWRVIQKLSQRCLVLAWWALCQWLKMSIPVYETFWSYQHLNWSTNHVPQRHIIPLQIYGLLYIIVITYRVVQCAMGFHITFKGIEQFGIFS